MGFEFARSAFNFVYALDTPYDSTENETIEIQMTTAVIDLALFLSLSLLL